MPDLVVAGGGAAGFMAAITAAEAGLEQVEIWEATPEPLAKVRISGGGRCNLTHACWDPSELVNNYPRGERPLRGPFSRFATVDAVAWFSERGVELQEEADGRIFPVSNSSATVVQALRRRADAVGVEVHTKRPLQTVQNLNNGGFALRPRGLKETVDCSYLLLATGGHPSGRKLAQELGHRLVAPVPSLFTLRLEAPWLKDLAGVSQDLVPLELSVGTERFRQRGTVLITHWGISGPAVLRLTAFAARALHKHQYQAQLRIDWSAGVNFQILQDQVQQSRFDLARKKLANGRPLLLQSLKRRLWLALLNQAKLDLTMPWAQLSRQGEQRLIQAVQRSSYPVLGKGPIGEEFVTAGGVDLAEVDLSRMQSRKNPGLYFAGEILDIDGVTGGFNFQHCWTSGWIAGQAIAANCN
jgi:predicted Rossmann fold flavoprotein